MFRDLPEEQQIGGYPTPGQLTGNVDELTLDSEGRCVVLEFPGFVLLGIYSPANRDESRDEFRTEYFEAIDVRVRNLIAMGKEVILTGDLNVIRSALDTSNLSDSLRKNDMTMDEWLSLPTRRLFNQLIHGGQVRGLRDEGRQKPVMWDLTRCFHPGREGMNTCWDTKKNTRPANNGSRIDYILCSDGLKQWFSEANIQEGLMGSDHCPVFTVLTEVLEADGKTAYVSDLVNPSDMIREGQRLRTWSQKDLLPLSARLIPEFDGRRSIRDMFSKGSMGFAKPQSTEIEQSSSTSSQRTHLIASTVPATPKSTSSSARSTFEQLVPSVRSPQKTAAVKRSAQLIDSTTKPSKRSKPLSATSRSKTESGQKTLQGFFRPKESAPRAGIPPEREMQPATTPPSANSLSEAVTSAQQSQRMHDCSPTTSTRSPHQPYSDSAKPGSTSATTLFDPIEAKESWSKLLGKRVVPRCEHNEACISLLTKKPGVNCGRRSSQSKGSLALYSHGILADQQLT